MFVTLPNGLHATIIEYLRIDDIFKLSQTCNYINQIISDDIIIIHHIVSKIVNKRTNKFYKNKKYDLLKMKMGKFFKKCKINNIIKYIVDNAITLECKDNLGKRPIHYICEHCNPEIIKYIGDKNVDLDCMDNGQYEPIHYICQYSTPDILTYFIDKFKQLNNTDIYIEPYTYDLKTPLYIAISQNNNKMVNILLDNIIRFNYVVESNKYADYSSCGSGCYDDDDANNCHRCDDKGITHILHYTCRSNLNDCTIQKMFDKYEYLDFIDHHGWHTSHYICFSLSYDLIKYAIDIKQININKEIYFDLNDKGPLL
jgi:hypothetical protein